MFLDFLRVAFGVLASVWMVMAVIFSVVFSVFLMKKLLDFIRHYWGKEHV